MKNIIPILGLLIVLVITSCKKDNVATTPDRTIIQSGKWRITSFVDNNVDKTANYAAYEFTFNANGTLNATTSSTNINGTWSLGTDDSKEKLVLNFSSASFESLSEDWLVKKIDDNSVQLTHASGGNGGNSILEFGKK